jgi:hypothetical protein
VCRELHGRYHLLPALERRLLLLLLLLLLVCALHGGASGAAGGAAEPGHPSVLGAGSRRLVSCPQWHLLLLLLPLLAEAGTLFLLLRHLHLAARQRHQCQNCLDRMQQQLQLPCSSAGDQGRHLVSLDAVDILLHWQALLSPVAAAVAAAAG